MICPRLAELPSPPSGKTGWPWTEESHRMADNASEGQPWPRISVITPSFNQGEFIEETIRSILLQGYPELEYFILDGGSTDGSVEIIKKYSCWLSYWVSEPDDGQSDAINRGLRMGTGSFATWINSDDLLCKNAFVDHARRIGFAADTVYVGICLYIDLKGRVFRKHRAKVHSFDDLVRVAKVWRSGGHLVQPEVLFPRELALAVGGLDPHNHAAMDYELWGKLFLAGANFHYTDVLVGMFRVHPEQKTQDGLRQTESLLAVARKLVLQAKFISKEAKAEILTDLDAYYEKYKKEWWKTTGRFARIGFPPQIVTPVRNLTSRLRKFVIG